MAYILGVFSLPVLQFKAPGLLAYLCLPVLITVFILVPGKKYSEAGVHKIYGKKSVGITNSLRYKYLLLGTSI